MKVIKKNKGFTLVELIVVIAIIGILSAVLIPSITGYIDKARMSNDTTYVAKLNNLLEYYEIQGGNLTGAKAPDIRTILKNETEEEINLTPQSKNAGFFYNELTKKIEVQKYDNAGVHAAETPNSPEELFGNGLHLLTTSGNVIAETVYGLRSLPNETDIASKFTALSTTVNGIKNNVIKATLSSLLTEFNHEDVLFVNNQEWRITKKIDENSVETFRHVIFAEGITNVPNNTLSVYIRDCADIFIPITVKTIEEDAFTRFFDTVKIEMGKNKISIAIGAFEKDQLIKFKIKETGIPTITLNVKYRRKNDTTWKDVNVNSITDIYVSNNPDKNITEIEFFLTNSLKTKLTDFQVFRSSKNNKTYYTFKLYSTDGLIGISKFEVNIIDLDVE